MEERVGVCARACACEYVHPRACVAVCVCKRARACGDARGGGPVDVADGDLELRRADEHLPRTRVSRPLAPSDTDTGDARVAPSDTDTSRARQSPSPPPRRSPTTHHAAHRA
jgi:hypothetical protein